MSSLDLSNVKISKETPENEIRKLLQVFKPDWRDAKLCIKTLSGGYSCDKYWVKPQNSCEDGLLFRVRRYFDEIKSLATDYELEIKTVKQLSNIGLFPKIYAVFGNGYCYQYIQGKPMANFHKPEETFPFDQIPLKEVFEKFAEIHSCKLEGETYNKSDFFETIYKMLDTEYKATFPAKEAIKKELDQLIKICNKNFKLNVTLCHGDAHFGNILWNQETRKVTFMDWELTHKGYQAFDLIYLISSLTANEFVDLKGFPKCPNPTETKREVLKYYYDRWYELNCQNNVDVHLYDYQEFSRLMEFFTLLYYMIFIVLMGGAFDNVEKMTANLETDTGIEIKTIVAKFHEVYWKVKEDTLRQLNLL